MNLEERARAELLAIRKTADGLTAAALTHSPVICGLLGNGDPLVAYNSLKHALLSADADTSLKAAMSSLGLASDKRTHLGRLEDFGDQHGYDQRQARRYSDRGVRQLARFIATNWALESVPCLDIYGYQTDDDSFAFMAETRCQYFIEMQPLRTTLYREDDEPVVVELATSERQDGIWNRAQLDAPIQIDAHAETSLAWLWRGELWPKFSVQWRTDLTGYGVTSESLGNKLMVRLLPIDATAKRSR